MKDENKTKKQLISEISELRQQIAESQKSETAKIHDIKIINPFRRNLFAFIKLLNNSGIGIDVVGIDYKIYYQNMVLKEKFGDCRGKLCYEKYMALKQPCNFCPMLKAIETNKVESVKLTGSDGRYYELFSAPFPNPDGTIDKALEIIFDITEGKHLEKELKESYETLNTLINTIPEIIYFKDAQGRNIVVNKAYEESFGFKKENIIGKTDYEFLPQNLAAQCDKSDKEAFRKRKIINTEEKITDKYGYGKNIFFETIKCPILDEKGKITGLVGISRDITRHRRMENLQYSLYKISEAIHSTVNLEEFYHSIHDIIAKLMPVKNNFYIALYDAHSNMLSFPYFVDEYEDNPGAQILGNGLTEYVLRTGKPLLASPEIFENLLKRGEIKIVGPPTIDWLGVPLKIKERTIGVLAVQSYKKGIRFNEEDKNVLTFISEQVAIAIERKQTQERLKASINEKEMMLREIHHRIKNNLQVVSSLINLQSRYVNDKKDFDMFKKTRDRIRSMALIHEKLYQSEDLTKIDFSQYIKTLTVHLLQSFCTNPDDIRVKTDIKNVFLGINTAIPCGMIINELMSNSLKHAFSESKINKKRGRLKKEIYISFHPVKDRHFSLSIGDNGVGLPERLDFQNPKSLGLQLVKDLVKQINGSIEVKNNSGTTFKIIFEETK